jgi:branched-chain amino acid transport system permease protein
MQDYLSALTPQYWPFWIGLVLVAIVLVGRDRIASWTAPIRLIAARLDWRTFGRQRADSPPEGH